MLRHPLPPKLLRVVEVAELMGVSSAYIRRQIESGKLIAVTLDSGRDPPAYRVSQEEFSRFIRLREEANVPRSTRGRLLRIPDIKV